MEAYAAALERSELTPDSLAAAEQRLTEAFSELPYWTPAHVNDPLIKASLRRLFTIFTGAVSLSTRGLDGFSDRLSQRLTRNLWDLGVKGATATEVRKMVRQTADDSRVYPALSMAEFITRKMPSTEALLATMGSHVPGLRRLSFAGTPPDAVIGGPRQAEMVRLALQYSITRPEDRVLEIGYGTPAVLLGISYYTGIRDLTGIDPSALPDGANDVLKTAGVELLEGRFPDSRDVLERAREKGKFTLVVALDTIKKDKSVLVTSVSPYFYVRSLYSLLDEGGTLVILNDYEGEPYFTRAHAEAAGFQVVRWGLLRELSPSLKALMPYEDGRPSAGRLRGYILRRGDPRVDRLRGQLKVLED